MRSVGRPSRARRAAPRGFTLIEAMTVVAMVAIVSAIAAPSFRSFIATMNAKSATFDLIADLATARSEAIKLNQTITLAPVSGSWANGWQITDGNGTVLRERPAPGYSLSVSGADVTFGPNGRLAADTADSLVKWDIASSISGVTPRCVVITPTGAARSKSGSCS
jgi:type IV fimbrial biogenesis protein FimT